MPYISNTEEQVKEMFKELNIKSFDDLVVDIPKSIRLKGDYNISSGLSELEVKEKLDSITKKNKPISLNHCFLGGGFEFHYIPPVVKQMIMRSEFYTAYTPYQPEISQGMLQAIFEYQTYICMLTGMDVANASGYDGGTCTVDATIMAIKQTNSKKVMFSKTINPEYIRVFDTYNIGMQAEKDFIPVSQDFSIDFKGLEEKLSKDHYSCVVVQMPNYFGYIEEYTKISELCKKYKSLFVVVLEPFAVGLLKTPGELGADIVVGEGQSLGCPVYLGGATVGFLAAKKDLMRLVPGRIVGQTTAEGGKTAYVLTLQTREQHIRREKASSNICSNQALLALMVTIYLSAIGKDGFNDIAKTSFNYAHYAYDKLLKNNKIKPLFPAKQFFNKFLVKVETNNIHDFYNNVLKKDFAAGIIMEHDFSELKNTILLTFTEINSIESIDKLIDAMATSI